MTTYHTAYETDGVPAPPDCELVDTRVKYEVVPEWSGTDTWAFVAHDLTTDRLVIIVGKAEQHHYVDRRGCLHLGCDITEDLRDYAAMKAADAQDLAETQEDALR